MSDTEDHKKFDGLKNLFEELDEADHASARLVSDAINFVRSKGHLTSFGALTDVLAPEHSDKEVRRKAQVLAATMQPAGAIDPGRRKALFSILGLGAGSVGLGTLAGIVANVVTHELYKEDTYAESFIRQVLQLHSDRPALWQWRQQLLGNGRTDEAELISRLAVHGEGFGDAFTAINRLRELIDAAKISNFTKAYLELNYATHHRYLGLTRQAFDLQDAFVGYSSDDAQLNVLLLNHRYMNRHLVLGDFTQLSAMLPPVNADLALAMREMLDIDAGSVSADSFGRAKDISVECMALKGIYLKNNCIASRTEREALEALDLVDQFRRGVVSYLIAPEVTNNREWMAVRLYGEAVWNYGRIAPIAWIRGWDHVLTRCMEAFYSSDAAANSSEASVMEEFHRIEGAELRSPIWVQMALIQAMHAHVASDTGVQSLIRLLPQDRQFKIRHHSELQRSLDAMTVAFGGLATDVSALNSLAAIESSLLLQCVQEMLRKA